MCPPDVDVPYATSAASTSLEYNSTILSTCIEGYILPDLTTTQSLRCDSTGTWNGEYRVTGCKRKY